LKPFIGKTVIKVLTGQRRVGKSYHLFQVINLIKEENQEAAILYINKVDLAFSFIKTADDLNEYILDNKSKSGKTYLLLMKFSMMNILNQSFNYLCLMRILVLLHRK